MKILSRSIAVCLTAAALVVAAAGSGRAQPAGGGSNAIQAVVAPHQEDAPEGLDTDARLRLLWLDFGSSGGQPPGAWFYDGFTHSDAFGWSGGMVRIVNGNRAKYGWYVSDFVEGEDAWFFVSVGTTTPCRFLVTFGDPEKPRGPVRVEVPGVGQVRDIVTKAGEFRDVSFEVPPVAGKLAVRFVGDGCSSFAISGLAVYAMPGTALTHTLFPGTSQIQVGESGPGSLAAGGPVDSTALAAAARESLKQIAWYLVRMRPSEGCFSVRGAWYESAYPIRTLLAAGRLFDEAAFTNAAFDCLDRFQSERLPDDNWNSQYFGRRDCALARWERENPHAGNLADTGMMMIALIRAAADADSARRERYLDAARKYLDAVVLPSQLPDGSFPNQVTAGGEDRHTYSMATGVQAAVLSAAARETGDARYQVAADSAARSLLRDFMPDGRYNFHRHDHPTPSPIPTVRFGDLFSVMEGLLWVREATPDTALAGAIDRRLREYVWGTGGISAYRINDVLWHPMDDREASKTGALLLVLNSYVRLVSRGPRDDNLNRRKEDTERWIQDFVAYLRDPRQAGGLGVGVDPSSAKGAFAFPATGFAGLGLVSTVDLPSVYGR